jgi:hypothetical protein
LLKLEENTVGGEPTRWTTQDEPLGNELTPWTMDRYVAGGVADLVRFLLWYGSLPPEVRLVVRDGAAVFRVLVDAHRLALIERRARRDEWRKWIVAGGALATTAVILVGVIVGIARMGASNHARTTTILYASGNSSLTPSDHDALQHDLAYFAKHPADIVDVTGYADTTGIRNTTSCSASIELTEFSIGSKKMACRWVISERGLTARLPWSRGRSPRIGESRS